MQLPRPEKVAFTKKSPKLPHLGDFFLYIRFIFSLATIPISLILPLLHLLHLQAPHLIFSLAPRRELEM